MQIDADFEAERLLESTESTLGPIFHSVHDAIYIYALDEENRPLPFINANAPAQALIGYSLEELRRLSIYNIVHPSRIKTVLEAYQNLVLDGVVVFESLQVAKDGRVIPMEVSMKYMELCGVRYVISVCQDVTEREDVKRQMIELANFDDETGFPNEYWLRKRLAEWLGRREIAVIAIGLHEFVEMRDNYGQAIMNEALRELLIRVQRSLQAAYVGKLNSREFAVIVHGEDAERFSVDAIIAQIQRPISVRGFIFRFTGTYGIALTDTAWQPHVDGKSILTQAILALHVAEQDGVTFRTYSHRLKQRFEEKHDTYLKLIDALDRDELVVAYQPKWSRNGRMVGAEALARWQTGDKEYPPSMFIPIAEELGLIHQLGLRILDRVCRDISTHPILRDSDLVISVNCSVKQLDRDGFVNDIYRILSQSNISPRRIVFEVTESIFADSGKRLALLDQVQRLGHKLAIDDFGTGYSSLQYFRVLSPDIVKIDQSFVRDLGSERKSEIIVESMIDLAHNLGSVVVAEGVETEAQWRFLKNKGCDIFQGYLLGKPMSIQKLLEVIEKSTV